MNRSPIKWAGGKSRVIPKLLEHLPKADCLIEPFVGSGAVFMNTDYRRYILCDSSRALINFFHVLTTDTERLINITRSMFHDGNDEAWYYEQRKLFNDMRWSDLTEADPALKYATLFLYLNRHGYNGVYRINRKGEFNVPFGKYAKPYFPSDEMRLFAEKARDTHALFICADFRSSIPESTQIIYDAVIYCDPPYIPASSTANFTAYDGPFTLNDHRDLVNTLLEARGKYDTPSVISNSDTQLTHDIYSPAFRLHALSVRRSVSAKSRDMAGEVIGVLEDAAC